MTLSVEYEEDDDGDCRTFLVVKHNGVEVIRALDGGEPEDQLFCRNWSWVKDAIERAYRLGQEDGPDGKKEA